MKTALCLSGHLRTFKYTAHALRRNIIEPLNCDVFIHTWDVLGAPTGKNPGDIRFKNTRTTDSLTEIYALLNPQLMSIEAEEEKRQQFIRETNNINVPANERQYIMQHVGLHVSMFYSIFKANELKNEYGVENGVEYDLVIRCRPDLYFTSQWKRDMFPEQNKLYVPIIATYAAGGMNDQVAVGCPRSMEIYTNIYHNIVNYYRQRVCTARPEVMMRYHASQHQLPIQTLPIEYDLYRLDGSILKQFNMHAEWAPGTFDPLLRP